MVLFKTHMWMAWPSACREASLTGVMSDLEEPDRDIVAVRVAARHSGMPGAAPEADLHETCHLSRVTAAVRKWKKPS